MDNLEDKTVDEYLKDDADQLREDVELIENVYPKFEIDSYLEGKLSPVFFGSALNNFGVKELLDNFIQIAPSPIGRESDTRKVLPEEKSFTGFVFKIHANMDPKHRDRIAFVRIVSGVFKRNTYYQHVRLNRKLKFSSPTSFMAQKKSIVDEMYPGDIVGLHDTGNFKIGDTITDGETLNYKGIPSFSPEIFKELQNNDPMKSKQLEKGIQQLTDEGVAQLFIKQPGNRKIVGTVGELQFEVIQYRLKHEYNAECTFVPKNYFKACWMTTTSEEQLAEFLKRKASYIVSDKDSNPVFLAESPWLLSSAEEDFPEITFHKTSEFKLEKS